MAAFTSKAVTGNASVGSNWVGDAAPNPAGGDTITIVVGADITLDQDCTFPGTGGVVGITINGTGSAAANHGILRVATGVTLTLAGTDTTTSAAMRIIQWGRFIPAAGSIILGNCASAWQTIIRNEGRISAIGTSGSHITFSVPAGGKKYDNAVAAESKSSSDYKWDEDYGVCCFALSNPWISNAAGDGPGAIGDSSFAKTATPSSPTTILVTEVATKALVNGAGKYFIDYDLGMVFFYHNATTSITAEVTYKYATAIKGWGINSLTNQTGHEALFDYCDFSWMGDSNTNQDHRVLDIQNKQTAAVASDRLAYVKNCTFNYCNRPIGLKANTGTAGDPLLITGNTFNASLGNVDGLIEIYRSSNSFVKIDSNTFRCNVYGIHVGVFSAITQDTFVITNNSFVIKGEGFVGTGGCSWPDLTFSGNTIIGAGGLVPSGRAIANVYGTSGHPATFSGNTIAYSNRAISFWSYTVIEKNLFYKNYHHGVNTCITNDCKLTNARIRNNLFYGETTVAEEGYDSGCSVDIGYFQGNWLDDVQVVNNTFCGNPYGGVGIGNNLDVTNYWAAITRLVIANNLSMINTTASSVGWKRSTSGSSGAGASGYVTRAHVTYFDRNLDYNFATRYSNINRQGMFSKGGQNYNDDSLVTRAIDGVALFSPNYAPSANRTLDFTYTSATDITLSWDGGTAVQLVFDSGTATAGANGSALGPDGTTNGSLTDSGKSWSTTKNNASCPACHWVKITGGTGSGQIRIIGTNTATVLTVVPAWTTPPDATSTYSIIRTEVTLADSGGSNTVNAGVYLPDLPVTTQQDTGISFADNSVTGSSPLLVDSDASDTDPLGSPGAATSYYISAGSPAIGIGTSVYGATSDYIGTTRDASPDAGFFEYVAAAAASGAGPGTYLRWTAGRLNVRVPPHYRR